MSSPSFAFMSSRGETSGDISKACSARGHGASAYNDSQWAGAEPEAQLPGPARTAPGMAMRA